MIDTQWNEKQSWQLKHKTNWRTFKEAAAEVFYFHSSNFWEIFRHIWSRMKKVNLSFHKRCFFSFAGLTVFVKKYFFRGLFLSHPDLFRFFSAKDWIRVNRKVFGLPQKIELKSYFCGVQHKVMASRKSLERLLSKVTNFAMRRLWQKEDILTPMWNLIDLSFISN